MATKRFNVCFLNARFFPIGGTAIRTLNFAKAIKNWVKNVNIITWQPTDTKVYNQGQNFHYEGVLLDSMPLKHQFLRKNLRILYLIVLLRDFFIFSRNTTVSRKIDIIHCSNDTIWTGILLSKFSKIPVVADFHATPSLPGSEMLPAFAQGFFQHHLPRMVLKIVDKSVSRYVTPTEDLRTLLISWGIPPWKVTAIPNAISIAENRSARSRNSVRSELGIGEDTVLIAFHGVLVEQYNIDAIKNLSIISKTTQKHPNLQIKFLIIGYYGNNPPVCDENFIYTGYVDSLEDYFRAADFALIPLLHADGIRSRILDYFKASLPVLTTPVGITGMPFAKASGGVIVRNSINGLANSATELANSKEKIQKMSIESGKLVQWFLPDKIGKELVSLYEQAVYRQG